MKRLTPKERAEAKRLRRQKFMVEFGVYVAIAVGVIGSQAINLSKETLAATLAPIELAQVGGALIVAGAVYNKMEGAGELSGKIKNVGRLLRMAIYHGFFWMTIIGAWW